MDRRGRKAAPRRSRPRSAACRLSVPTASTPRGVDVSDEDIAELLRVDVAEWKAQLPHFHEHLGKFDRLPKELQEQLLRSSSELA